MALVLSLKLGQDFFVEAVRFILIEVTNDVCFRLKCEAEDCNDEFTITDKQSVEIMPEVFVSAGDCQQLHAVKAVIEAPSDLLVLRGDKYRNPPLHLKVTA